MAKKQVVRTFKTTPIIEQSLEMMEKQLGKNKSALIKLAISKMAAEVITWEEGS